LETRVCDPAVFGSNTASEVVIETPGWLEAPWHYVSIGYPGRQLGLRIETGDEERGAA